MTTAERAYLLRHLVYAVVSLGLTYVAVCWTLIALAAEQGA